MTSDPEKIYGLTSEDAEIFHVIEQGNRGRLVELLQAERACLTVRMKDPDQTPLMVAVSLGRPELCELLLDAGAPIDATNRFGQTALHFALVAQHEPLALRLLESGANVHCAEAGGSTPLHVAAQFCSSRVLEALIAAGGDVQAKRANESTPAIMAAFAGRADNVRVLAAHGAEIVGARCFANVGGPFDVCLTIASERGHSELLAYLLESFAWSSEVMNVALKLAAGEGHLAIAQALTAKGADPFAPSGANEKSALHRARQRKQPALVEFFKTLRQR